MKLRWTGIFLLAGFLVACGGGGNSGGSAPQKIVSFGDSLSDAGTYAVIGNPAAGPLLFNAGRYTTNPGEVWSQQVARYYGDILTPAQLSGFGSLPVDNGGLGYAQGGAKVAADPTPDEGGATALSVVRQIDAYLAAHGAFDGKQLILLQGGANDIVNAVLAAQYGYIEPDQVAPLVSAAATSLAAQVGRIVNAGGQKIALLNMSDIGATPLALQYPQAADALTQMSLLFNTTLQSALAHYSTPPDFVLIDAFGFYADTLAHYRDYGFLVANTDTGCSLSKTIAEAAAIGIADPQDFVSENGWALLCSASTLVEAGADQTYMFADLLHPTTHMQTLFAAFVEKTLKARGI